MAFTVLGIFKEQSDVNKAKKQLEAAGFHNDRVDVSPYRRDNKATKNAEYYDYEEDEKTSGFWDWLMGDDEDDRHRYSRVAADNHVLTVHAADRAEATRAAAIMDDCNALDVNKTAAAARGNVVRRGATATAKGAAATDKIKVVKENMNVGKRTVETGGVQLRSRIIEKPVEEKLRLREERVYVQRDAVNRPATEADFKTFKEGTVEVTERAEVPVVEKNARVVEEVSVGKEVGAKTETIRDTVRETKVEVVKKGAKDKVVHNN